MPLEGTQNLVPLCSRWEASRAIERVQAEHVPVRSTRRGTRSAVTDRPEVIPALPRTALECLVGRYGRREGACRRGEIVEEPVGEDSTGSIGILDDQDERGRPRRRFRLAERWGTIRAVAGVLGRQGTACGERRAGQLDADGCGWNGRTSACGRATETPCDHRESEVGEAPTDGQEPGPHSCDAEAKSHGLAKERPYRPF